MWWDFSLKVSDYLVPISPNSAKQLVEKDLTHYLMVKNDQINMPWMPWYMWSDAQRIQITEENYGLSSGAIINQLERYKYR